MTSGGQRATWRLPVCVVLLTLAWPQRAVGQGQILEQQNSCFRCHRVIDDPRLQKLLADDVRVT